MECTLLAIKFGVKNVLIFQVVEYQEHPS